MSNSHDYFKKMSNLFESAEVDQNSPEAEAARAKRKAKQDKEETDWVKSKAGKPENVKESGADFFRKYSDIIAEAEEKEENVKAKADKAEDNYKKGNVRANWGDKASGGPGSTTKKDDVNESWDDDDEDSDVAKADKEKGKDGKTQKDAEKKLPPWLQKKDAFAKKDAKDQDKGAKALKKDKQALANKTKDD